MTRVWVLGRWVAWGLMFAGGMSLVFRPESLPALVLAALATTMAPLLRAWRASVGTTLRPAVAWYAAALVLAMIAQTQGMTEAWATGRPATGHWSYVAMLAALAATISVLGARRPGGGAWSILMGLLVVVFLVPWLEGGGVREGASPWDRLRLEGLWAGFFAVLALTGVTNFLPTRFGTAMIRLGLGFVALFLGLTQTSWPVADRGLALTIAPMFLAVAAWEAEGCSRRATATGTDLDRLWLWYRDHWGVVWALRVRERWNRAALAASWPVRLDWPGVVAVPPTDEHDPPAAAVATLKGLLRRFADADRLAQAARGSSCDVEEVVGS